MIHGPLPLSRAYFVEKYKKQNDVHIVYIYITYHAYDTRYSCVHATGTIGSKTRESDFFVLDHDARTVASISYNYNLISYLFPYRVSIHFSCCTFFFFFR